MDEDKLENPAQDQQFNRRKVVTFTKEEVLLILRAYRQHPSNWSDIINDIKENLELLTKDQRQLYRTGTTKQIKDRVCHKFLKTVHQMPDNITDIDIRNEVSQIRRHERRLVPQKPIPHPAAPAAEPRDVQPPRAPAVQPQQAQPPQAQPPPAQPLQAQTPQAQRAAQNAVAHNAERPPQAQARNNEPGVRIRQGKDFRQEALEQQSDTDNEGPPPGPNMPIRAGQGRNERRRSLAALVRSNQMLYRRFMTKQIPKILAALQVSNDSSDDDYLN